MGASITMDKGAADAGLFPAVAVIGDSTFAHSGITGLLDAVNENTNITVVISDNKSVSMTGGQDSSAFEKIESICGGVGVNPVHIRIIVPLRKNHEEMVKMFREELAYKKLSKNYPFILLGVLFRLSCVEFSLNSGAIRVKFALANQKIRTNNSKK